MTLCTWGDICTLEYGKALRDYPAEPNEAACHRVFGTNGPIGWTTSALCEGPGIIIGRKGAYRGVHYSPAPFFVIDTAYYVRLVVPDVDLKWAYYKLLTVDINRIDVGAAIPTTSREAFYALPVALPSRSTQQRVAAMLTAYDDLIENNRRRIALLEQAARLLYEEWFVRLRFPGHEHTRITNGVPEGWERRPLGTCVKFLSGGTPSKSQADFWDGDIPWISSGEMTELRLHDSSLRLTQDGVDQGSRLAPANTILVVVRGMSLAKEFRISMTGRPVAFNQDLKAFSCNSGVSPEYVFSTLISQRNQIRDRATEASHGTKKLETSVLAAVPVLLPTEQLQRKYAEMVGSMNALWDNCWAQNQRLRAARDLLLPRLMSGAITV